ncbi:unnamed protein product [Tenebrio molitor]|nr:unnamed protein product [Tenebrio molitor]
MKLSGFLCGFFDSECNSGLTGNLVNLHVGLEVQMFNRPNEVRCFKRGYIIAG